MHQTDNSCEQKELQTTQTDAYKPAYKKNPETAIEQPKNLPPDLAEIVTVWPELPEHIKGRTMKTLKRKTRSDKFPLTHHPTRTSPN